MRDQLGPHLLLEGGAVELHRDVELGALAGEVLLELRRRLLEDGRHVVGVAAPVPPLVGQPDADQHVAVALQDESADRGVEGHGGGGGEGRHAARPFIGGVGISAWTAWRGQRPQVGHGVAAPRPPALGGAGEARRVVGQAERPRRPADAEVGRHERVGVAQRAHGHVLGRPGPDAREPHQLTAQLERVGARIDDDVAALDRVGQRARAPAAAPPAWRRRPGRARPARPGPPASGRGG